MKYVSLALVVTVFLGLSVSSAWAQGMLVPVPDWYEAYRPAVNGFDPAPASYGPTVVSGTAYGSSMAYYPASSYPASSYTAPSYAAPSYAAPGYAAPGYAAAGYAAAGYAVPAVAYRPAPVPYVQPVAAYRPVVPAYSRPYVVYSPTVVAGYSAPAYSAPAYSAPAAIPAGPKVIVRPKIVWVEGQPIRNLLRAITP
jgi:DNA-directed RNA polymerase II subunit RPB1